MKRIAFLNGDIAGDMEMGVIIFSKEYGILGESPNARALLKKILEQ